MVLGTGLVLMACGSKSLTDSRTAGSDSYGLNVESMTGTDSYQMELQESEVLAVHFETVRGSMCMEIQAPDGSLLYQGNGKGVTEFTVNIPESGTYSIFVEAHRAKGIIQVQRKEERNGCPCASFSLYRIPWAAAALPPRTWKRGRAVLPPAEACRRAQTGASRPSATGSS